MRQQAATTTTQDLDAKSIKNKSPLILQRADPFLTLYDGVYYFTASVPTYDCIEIRSSDTIDGLKTATPKIVWTKHKSGIMSEHIWAPEMHLIDGVWYIYFAASQADNKWELRPYALRCTGSDPMADRWEEAGAMIGVEGDDAFTDFSLDGTVFEHKGERYFVWAEKVGKQFGISNLYIAAMESPTKLKTKRVLISTPEHDWETVDFWVNEGAAVIKRHGKIFMTFSASATGAMYCMGLLTADENADLLDPKSWVKTPKPIFTTNPDKEIYGPGHNSFSVDEEGKDICIFHARPYEKIVGDPLYDHNRNAFVVRYSVDKGGMFDFEI